MEEKITKEIESFGHVFDDVKTMTYPLINNKKLLKQNVRFIGIISSIISNMNAYYTKHSDELLQDDMNKLLDMVTELEIIKFKLIKKV